MRCWHGAGAERGADAADTDMKERVRLGLMVSALVAVSAGLGPSPSAASAQRTGVLHIRIAGLPGAERPTARLRGPRVNLLVRATRLVLGRAKPGRYVLTLGKATIGRRHGPIRKGAIASPQRRRFTVRVRAGRSVVLRGRYVRVVNPGVARVGGTLIAVKGPPANPRGLVLAGRHRLVRGQVLSRAPDARLPRGLLAYVVSARYAHGRTAVALRPASVYEVVPTMRFSIRVTPAQARSSSLLACGGPSTGLSPYRTIKDISVDGGWNTARVLRRDIPVGVRATVRFTAEAGLDATSTLGVACKLQKSVAFSGMAGPVPVTGAVYGELSASAGAGGTFKAYGSMRVEAGATTVGTPPVMVWKPSVAFGDPRFGFESTRFAEATAGIGVGVKVGLGNDNAASATVKLGSTLGFTARPGGCDWDARFGQFSAEGKVLGWTIESPKTPPFYTKSLWHGACAGPDSGSGGAQAGRTKFAQISAAWWHTCGVRQNRTVVCWGNNGYGQDAIPPGEFVQVAAGALHTCGLRANGTAICWGGSLDSPETSPGPFTQIAAGTLGMCGLRPDASVTCRELSFGNEVSSPTGPFTAIAVGGGHICGLRPGGAVACWGSDDRGQSSPPPGTFTQLTAGYDYTCGVRTDGTAACWGDNDQGQSSPPSETFIALAASGEPFEPSLNTGPFTCGLRQDSTVACWGWNSQGQASPPPGRFTQLTAGGAHACGLRPDATASCWGWNEQGKATPP